MAHDANIRSSDPRNYQLPGSVCLFFRKKGSVADADWKSLGNIIDPAIAAELERLEHFSQRRGSRAKDKEVVSERSATLNFSIDEINRDNLQFMFGREGGHTNQDDVDTLHEGVFTVPAAGSDIDLGMTNIVGASVVVRSLELEPVETTYATPADYTVTPATGKITIVAAGALDGGPAEVHIFWRKQVDTQKFTIFPGTEVEGEAQFQVLTPGGIQWFIRFKNVSLINNGDITIGDGTAFQEIPLSVNILVDQNGDLGTFYIIDSADVFA